LRRRKTAQALELLLYR